MEILRRLFLVSLLSAIISFSAVSQNLTFTFGLTPTQLVENHLLGSGIIASNITGNYGMYSGAAFSGGTSVGMGLTSGIALSTGVLNYNSNSSAYFASATLGAPGDPLLSALVAPHTTYDAQIIEFDFSTASDSVEFDFVFASEEYNEYVNSIFTDVFAFFISGPGYANNTNVALVPGTNVPVAINYVNNGNSSGASTGPCTNCQYYIDNIGNTVQVVYDGLTTVLKIKFSVWPCADYNFKIAIADVSDGILDSFVALGENSFVACPNMQVTENNIPVSDTLYICQGGSVLLTAPESTSYYWNTGEITQSILVTQPGSYFCSYQNTSGTCSASTDPVIVSISGAVLLPVITQNGTTLLSNILPVPGISFQWLLDGNIIPGATANSLTISGNGCYSLIVTEGTCEYESNPICVTGTSIIEIGNSAFSVHPHPVSGISVVNTPFITGLTTISIYDVTGKLVLSQTYGNNEEIKLSGHEMNNGLYFIRIQNSMSSEVLHGKIVNITNK